MSQFNDLSFATADERRTIAKKFGRFLPPDMASLAAATSRSNLTGSLPNTEARTTGSQTLTVLPRLRVLTALIEPNVIRLARNNVLSPRCQTDVGPDGVFVTRWETITDHDAAYRNAYNHYEATHEVVREVGNGSNLDSWHSPLLLIPVRHEYADGTAPISVWMCADGNARIWGARTALAADLRNWNVTHDWTDPAAHWSLNVATLRAASAAARTNSADPDATRTRYPVSSGSVEDWADLLVPDPQMRFTDLGSYLYHSHNTPAGPGAEPSPFVEDSHHWVASLDVFGGKNPFDLMGLDPANVEDRDEVAYAAEAIQSDLLTVVSNKNQTARRIALAAVAFTQSAPSTEGAADVFADKDHVVMFRQWLHIAMSKTRRLDWSAQQGVLTLLRALTTLRAFPDCDLYGIDQDLDNTYLYAPLDDPSSDWFTLTAMRALTYAILHGHLMGEEQPHPPAYVAALEATYAAYEEAEKAGLPTDNIVDLTRAPELAAEVDEWVFFVEFPDQIIERLLNTPEGHAAILSYAEHALAGTIPENLFRYRAEPGVGERVDILTHAPIDDVG